MQNVWNIVTTNLGIDGVNIKTCGRIAPTCTMDLHSLEKFKKYKNDWNYPVQFSFQEQVVPDKKKQRTTFQSAMKVTLTIGQCFGLNPVQGVLEQDASKIRFKFRSWRFAYTFITMTGQFILALVLLLSLFRESSFTLDTAGTIIFYGLGLTTTILNLRIAMKWPKLSMLISKVETVDPNADTKLGRNINIACIGMLSCALLEHSFSELHGISLAFDCDPEIPLYESFMRHTFGWLFSCISYNDVIGFLAYISNLQCTFNWNYNDVFIICMSIYLTSRLEQINQRIIAAKDKNFPSSFWRTMRKDYNRSVHLIRQFDKIIGGIIFISFASNLFSVCSQLLHTLAGGFKATLSCRADTSNDRFLNGYGYSIYFAYSFGFLVVRWLAVALFAAKVHTASLEPAHSLYDVSSANYCVEVKRFLDQIHGDTVTLSGLQFFNIKRGLVLTIAGTIVTYELVLMQFSGVSPASPESI